MAYSTDDDLVLVQKDILNLGVDNFDAQHNEAEQIINRDINLQWFTVVATERGYNYEVDYDYSLLFDPDLLLDTDQFKRLSVYKTLELAYLFVMMDSEDSNPFMGKRLLFKGLYEEELKAVLSVGISYDWDGDGNEDRAETNLSKSPRIIYR